MDDAISEEWAAAAEPQLLKKHEDFLARRAVRQKGAVGAKAAGETPVDQRSDVETPSLFWERFYKEHAAIVDDLEQLEVRVEPAGDLTPSQTAAAIEALMTRAQALQRLTAESALFLPPYDVRRATEEVSKLTAKLCAARDGMAPRKKFSFKSKRRQQPPQGGGEQPPLEYGSSGSSSGTTSDVPNPGADIPTGASGNTAGAALHLAEESMPASHRAIQEPGRSGDRGGSDSGNSTVISGLAGQTLELRAEELPSRGDVRDVTLSGLESCTVALLGPTDALRLRGLRDCRVFCGPVRGSVYVEDCQRCCVAVASRQLRIHDTTATDLHVRTLSGPIIEGCDSLRFGPYPLEYPGLAEELAEAGLALGQAPGAESAWADVKDFKWLRAQQSPHWQLLPAQDRLALRTGLAVVWVRGAVVAEAAEREPPS